MKKIIVLVLLLTFAFTTKAFASLSFSTNAITGTTASTIDLGAGNDLSLQTTNNGKIIMGTGNVGIGNTNPQALLDISPNHDFQFLSSNVEGTGAGTYAAIATKYGGLYMGLASADTSYGIDVNPWAGGYNGTRILSYSTIGLCFTSAWPAIECPIVAGNDGSLAVGLLHGDVITPPRRGLLVNGHIYSSQTVGTTTTSVTGTGYSGSSLVAGSTDTKGKITAIVGANAGTLVITFSYPYVTAPVCTTDANTATAQVDLSKMYSTTSTTALTLNFVATPTGGSETWSYVCLQ